MTHHHKWTTRIVTESFQDFISGMVCECGARMEQDEVENALSAKKEITTESKVLYPTMHLRWTRGEDSVLSEEAVYGIIPGYHGDKTLFVLQQYWKSKNGEVGRWLEVGQEDTK